MTRTQLKDARRNIKKQLCSIFGSKLPRIMTAEAVTDCIKIIQVSDWLIAFQGIVLIVFSGMANICDTVRSQIVLLTN